MAEKALEYGAKKKDSFASKLNFVKLNLDASPARETGATFV